jgi:putative transcriptional regulator
MLYLRINEILEEKDKTMYWLSKQTGIAQNNINKICKGETSNIRFDTLEKICIALDCSVNDLFVTTDPRAKRLLYYSTLINEIHHNDENSK